MNLNNLSPLPFYTDIKYQNHRKSYVHEIFPLVSGLNRIPPFQFCVLKGGSTSSIYLYKADGTLYKNVTTDLKNYGYKVVSGTTYNSLVWSAKFPLTSPIEEGLYYIRIGHNGNYYYSEVFNSVASVSNFLQLEFWDNQRLVCNDERFIDFDGYKHSLLLQAEIGMPEYEFEEEIEKRDTYEFVEKQVSYKVYKTRFLAPEYMCDLLRTVRMSDNVTISFQGIEFYVDWILVTPKFQKGGALANVEVEFRTDTVIKKIPSPKPIENGGSFDDSFDDSYELNN